MIKGNKIIIINIVVVYCYNYKIKYN